MEVRLWPCIGFVAVVMRAISQIHQYMHGRRERHAHRRTHNKNDCIGMQDDRMSGGYGQRGVICGAMEQPGCI